MKHIVFSLALVAAGTLSAGAHEASDSHALAANNARVQATSERDLTITTYSAEYSGQATDQIGMQVEYDIESPTDGGAAVVAEINNWICERLDDKLHTHAGNLESYIQSSAQEELGSLKEMAIESELQFECTFESNISISCNYEDSDYVTFSCSDYKYLGGAHGMTFVYFQTFRKSDGKRMDWSLLEGADKDTVVKAIKAGLKDYFEADDDEELLSYLLIEADDYYNNFPLPESPPYLLGSGVEVIYQLYEISPYVAGIPMATVLTMDEFKHGLSQGFKPVLGTNAETTDGPGFPGGEKALMAHLANNLNYPEAAVELDIEGKVELRIEVKGDGSIGAIEVVQSLNPGQEPMSKATYLSENKGKTIVDYRRYVREVTSRNLAGEACDAEAIRVVRTLPPFLCNGESYWLNLPIVFRLQ